MKASNLKDCLSAQSRCYTPFFNNKIGFGERRAWKEFILERRKDMFKTGSEGELSIEAKMIDKNPAL